MHELALAEGILAVALDKAGGKRVHRVLVRAGARQRVDPESLESCFRIVAQDTPAAEATLLMEAVEGDRVLVDGVELEAGWRYRPGAAPARSERCA